MTVPSGSASDSDPQLDAFSVDVRALLELNVANLYSHLVTRPTGRAVRMAIESQLNEMQLPALSLLDLSAVSILDYSCADEVVAKLLIRTLESGTGTFLILLGMRAHHREPIEAVLERHELAVVAETATGRFELLGVGTDRQRAVWTEVEENGRMSVESIETLGEPEATVSAFDALTRRRLVFQDPLRGEIHALSTLIPRPS